LTPDFYELGAHHQVVVEKLSRIGLVRADPSDPRSEMDDHIGGSIAVELSHSVYLNEIVIFAAGHEDVSATLRTELFHDKRSKKACSACDDDALRFPK
jgi:hypothetical protein